MAGRGRLRRVVAIVTTGVTLVGVAACTSTTDGRGSSGSAVSVSPSLTSRAPSGSSADGPSSGGPSSRSATCPSTYLAPDPNRPRMRLAFTVAPGLATVAGREQIAFTPDKQITELVFRLTANTRPTVEQGNKIVVQSATADHGGGKFTISAANADPSTQGGLLHIPFAQPIAAGTTVNATIAFTVTLGKASFDRFGRTDTYAWFASAEPLLAWQRGYGWHDEDLIDVTAESTTSEAMDVDLTVTAPGRDTVIASGDPADPPTSSRPRTWHAHLNSARDVSVAVGPFSVSDTSVDGVRLRLGAFAPNLRDLLVPEFHRAIRALVALLGPFPFPSLSVARLPAGGGGIEYPSSILMLDGSRQVAVHETAHQYFYAMVGDSQSLHPWLDEAFAQYLEERIDNDVPDDDAIDAPGRVDSSVESYGSNSDLYYFTIYNKGAAALRVAQQAAGTAGWDKALRCYVAANAWRIVVPADFQRAISAFPSAIAVLKKAGALP